MTATHGNRHPRIVSTPGTMFGKPRIDGTRITVEHVLRRLAMGWSVEEIIDQHPRLRAEDIRAAIDFAADRLAETSPTMHAAE